MVARYTREAPEDLDAELLRWSIGQRVRVAYVVIAAIVGALLLSAASI